MGPGKVRSNVGVTTSSNVSPERSDKMSKHKFLKHLREDHAEQKNRGKKLIEARGPQERSQLRKQLHESLYPHMVGEEVSISDKTPLSGEFVSV
jgi:hypothetical protein